MVIDKTRRASNEFPGHALLRWSLVSLYKMDLSQACLPEPAKSMPTNVMPKDRHRDNCGKASTLAELLP